jgi:hypothetical protein
MKNISNDVIRGCLIALLAVTVSVAAEPRQDNRWVPIFDGKTLDGWTPKFRGFPAGVNYADTFRVEDGVISASYDEYDTFDGRFGHLFFKTPYSHYRLRFEYRIHGEPAADIPVWAFRNSGVMIHSLCPAAIPDERDFPTSLEFQTLAEAGEIEPRTTGNLCTPGTDVVYKGEFDETHCIDSSSPALEAGRWVSAEMLVLGEQKIVHFVNGEKVLEYEHPTYGGPGSPSFESLPIEDGQPAAGGYISLQAEGHPVQFRNIELMDLAGPWTAMESYCPSADGKPLPGVSQSK